MRKKGIWKKRAIIVTLCVTLALLVGTFSPSLSENNTTLEETVTSDERIQLEAFNEDIGTPYRYDDRPPDSEAAGMASDQNDVGYRTDAGNNVYSSYPLYIGEPIEGTIPGCGRTGTLAPDEGDDCDWYMFSVCEGQQIDVSLASSQDYSVELTNTNAEFVSHPYTVETTGVHFLRVVAADGAGAGDYTVSVTTNGQYDAGTNGDAGNERGNARAIEPGDYCGYMSESDREDWYRFDASTGEGIFITLESPPKSDYDVTLYNPSGEVVHAGRYYGNDEIEYPADATGTWTMQIDMFPGWDEEKWPDDYFRYGSGAYTFSLQVGGSAQAPPQPRAQPAINPVAQTFVVNDIETGNTDEYGYLAAIPAANYLDGGNRYLSPIVYRGVDRQINWFGTVDDTTQYLLDDWDTYLDRHGVTATEYVVPDDPVTAAADIATSQWEATDTAVLAIDGSGYTDEVTAVVDSDATLNVQAQVTTAPRGSSQLKDVGGRQALPMFVGSKWAVMTVYAEPVSPGLGIITPRYELGTEEDWPHPYDAPGDNTNIYFPITMPGLWFPYVAENSGDWTLEVTKYTGDRYKVPVDDTSSSLEVTVTTSQESYLEVFLVDPHGNIRRPSIPHWNDPTYENINPLHQWNGDHHNGFEDWRRWEPVASTEHSVEVHYPMEGKWTVIVAPHYPYGEEKTSDSIDYHITAALRQHSQQRTNAALSAANGAVLASLNHAPLLYVTADEVPAATQNALDALGASNIIFVNLGEISSANPGGTTYTTMQQVIDAIKQNSASENYITVTSLGTGDGYFAPAAMAAAYHGSPVLNIGEAPTAYDTLDKAMAWREYAGGWYHGCRALGHLPQMREPFEFMPSLRDLIQNQSIPEPGFDMKLRWFGAINEGVHGMIDGYGLDRDGKEAYLFVSPRDTDIRDMMCRAMTGNNSYAGHIPVETPGFSSAVIVRNIMYPALIYANPGRDVTTSQIMNYPNGYQWRANDGNEYPNYATQELKQSFSSHGRFYEGHTIWDNLLERYNAGASISYYSGHGTGGSGISAQYKCIADQFPDCELRHEELKDFEWWDGWRGYSGYDDVQTKTPRWGGESGYSASEPGLYDIIHFKWVDQAFDNLHSELEFWSSCTTASHFGPMVYLAHGSALYQGCCGSSYGVQDDLHNNWIFHDVMVLGHGVGEAQSRYTWIFNRDFTTMDPTTLYGRSTHFQPSMGGLTNINVLFGDPEMTCYNPNWTEPTPVSP